MTKIPEPYRRPAHRDLADQVTAYWIDEYDHHSATALYSVGGVDGDGYHIIAEKCYLHWAVRIVDALRATT